VFVFRCMLRNRQNPNFDLLLERLYAKTSTCFEEHGVRSTGCNKPTEHSHLVHFGGWRTLHLNHNPTMAGPSHPDKPPQSGNQCTSGSHAQSADGATIESTFRVVFTILHGLLHRQPKLLLQALLTMELPTPIRLFLPLPKVARPHHCPVRIRA
jgi:hypothetical protein